MDEVNACHVSGEFEKGKLRHRQDGKSLFSS